jgi:hypothetical protein
VGQIRLEIPETAKSSDSIPNLDPHFRLKISFQEKEIPGSEKTLIFTLHSTGTQTSSLAVPVRVVSVQYQYLNSPPPHTLLFTPLQSKEKC